MSSFIDERDSGPFYLSHTYLLLGSAVPVWLKTYFECVFDMVKREGGGGGGEVRAMDVMPMFAGVLILGIGDSMVFFSFSNSFLYYISSLSFSLSFSFLFSFFFFLFFIVM